jgi:hypothetical protein
VSYSKRHLVYARIFLGAITPKNSIKNYTTPQKTVMIALFQTYQSISKFSCERTKKGKTIKSEI